MIDVHWIAGCQLLLYFFDVHKFLNLSQKTEEMKDERETLNLTSQFNLHKNNLLHGYAKTLLHDTTSRYINRVEIYIKPHCLLKTIRNKSKDSMEK